jgi:hypothetical protein
VPPGPPVTSGPDINLASSIVPQRSNGIDASANVSATRAQASAIFSGFSAGGGAISTVSTDESQALCTAFAQIWAGPFSSGFVSYVLKDSVSGLYFPPISVSFAGANAFGLSGTVATANYVIPSSGTAGSFPAGSATLKVGAWQGTMNIYANTPASVGAFNNSGTFDLTITAHPDTSP